MDGRKALERRSEDAIDPAAKMHGQHESVYNHHTDQPIDLNYEGFELTNWKLRNWESATGGPR